ncbi:hypothetical protein E2C01_068831 [Portunus trituberculatus]|uniref:Secreted protein n=1 Tax=Portunus trituberculatus TaxID=210409 RepID=A0A5B7HNF7_PORTR|nr:hypothetical protein [Portunus trituberculatus]
MPVNLTSLCPLHLLLLVEVVVMVVVAGRSGQGRGARLGVCFGLGGRVLGVRGGESGGVDGLWVVGWLGGGCLAPHCTRRGFSIPKNSLTSPRAVTSHREEASWQAADRCSAGLPAHYSCVCAR